MKSYIKRENGFTLIEVLVVIIIIGVIGAMAIPKLASSIENARQKADIATGHQVKAALDRYAVENGTYPTVLTADNDGKVSCASLIPKYISKLDKTTTQQNVTGSGSKGFGVFNIANTEEDDSSGFSMPSDTDVGSKTHTIMIYLFGNGLGAEVRVYDGNLTNVLWSSVDEE